MIEIQGQPVIISHIPFRNRRKAERVDALVIDSSFAIESLINQYHLLSLTVRVEGMYVLESIAFNKPRSLHRSETRRCPHFARCSSFGDTSLRLRLRSLRFCTGSLHCFLAWKWKYWISYLKATLTIQPLSRHFSFSARQQTSPACLEAYWVRL